MTAVSAIEVHKAKPEQRASLLLARKMVGESRAFRAELAADTPAPPASEGGPMDLDDAFLVMLVRHPFNDACMHQRQALGVFRGSGGKVPLLSAPFPHTLFPRSL